MTKRLRPLTTHFAVLAFSLAALAAPQGTPPAADSQPITLTVNVTDKSGRYVSDLKKENFSVYDQKAPQEIISFDDRDAPASVAILFDVSSSMISHENFFRLLRNSVLSFIQQSNKANDYLIISFADSVQVLADWGSSDETLVSALSGLGAVAPKKGRTLVRDACYLGVEKLKGGAHPKRVLLLMTDGWDSGSRRTLDELHRALKDSDVLVYSVALGNEPDSERSDTSMLKRLAEISGGWAFFPTTAAETDEDFARIRLEIQHQYSLSYRPSNAAGDGKWHAIEVKVARLPDGPRLPSVTVRTREGYYAKSSQAGPR